MRCRGGGVRSVPSPRLSPCRREVCCSLSFRTYVGAWGPVGDPRSGRSGRRRHVGVRSGNQPGREPRGPEIPSAAAVCRAARRRGPHEAQLCSGNSATGDGARASAPPKSDPRDARLPNADASQLPTMPFHFSAER
ncbi:hypothetical protein NDU88_002188 [Pleurodeles waltl]|uniref:Uncharacterized protein n=1 Tax=Pleurodeles waltl TaxID=8319 RepID=A0AAV7U8P6_PLEWA|nr:hypothetical protein NDU88_002188 [Pleurodeles waltl]